MSGASRDRTSVADRVDLERPRAVELHAHEAAPRRAARDAAHDDLVAADHQILRLPSEIGNEGWQLPILGVYAIWPSTAQRATLMLGFLDFMASRVAALFEAGG